MSELLPLISWIEIFIIFGFGIFLYKKSEERSKFPLHMIQLQGYDPEAYMEWCEKNKARIQKKSYADERGDKSPLVMTERATRLYNKNLSFTGLLLGILVLIRIALGNHNFWPTILIGIAMYAIYYYQYIVMRFAAVAQNPQEKKINQGFYDQAQTKIDYLKGNWGLQVVGITGSFGKTSTKFIANTILSEQFDVQNTPSSYNTPMGLSKIINDELNQNKEVFLAELGAEVPGEIEEVANLVQPTIGVITAIGPTHMHLFKTIENIQNTKYELIESLDDDGVAIFNYDNEYVKPLADKTLIKKYLYGVEEIEKLDVYGKDIKVGERGSTFTLGIKGEGEITAETKLLGAHNISNLLAAATVAYVLGMELKTIVEGIKKVEPVEHRLSIVDGDTGVIVIDDAFNSNPVGARAALDVLSAFEKGKKIIITPGMVELGDIEEEENYKLGKEIADVVDYAILVGKKRTVPIQKGLREAGFPEEQLLVAKSLDEATSFLGGLTAPGDVVLFENDLPDNYNEE